MGFHTGETVRELVSGQPFAFDDLGERPMKGFEQPVRVWSARWSDM
jgi:class 3 adenylate cyclase